MVTFKILQKFAQVKPEVVFGWYPGAEVEVIQAHHLAKYERPATSRFGDMAGQSFALWPRYLGNRPTEIGKKISKNSTRRPLPPGRVRPKSIT